MSPVDDILRQSRSHNDILRADRRYQARLLALRASLRPVTLSTYRRGISNCIILSIYLRPGRVRQVFTCDELLKLLLRGGMLRFDDDKAGR